MTTTTPMPQYQSHKKVWAFKIKEINTESVAQDGSNLITPEEPGFAPFPVDKEYVEKHKPENGGYYVVYEDGYKSFSPAEAFESGYTRI